jgi:hypothetical protein
VRAGLRGVERATGCRADFVKASSTVQRAARAQADRLCIRLRQVTSRGSNCPVALSDYPPLPFGRFAAFARFASGGTARRREASAEAMSCCASRARDVMSWIRNRRRSMSILVAPSLDRKKSIGVASCLIPAVPKRANTLCFPPHLRSAA